MTPAKKIFNERLAGALHIVENAFGMLSNPLRILLRPMEVRASTAKLVVLSCCILHNILLNKSPTFATDAGSASPDRLRSVTSTMERNSRSDEATRVREYYVNYFLGSGSIPSQYRVLKEYERNQLDSEIDERNANRMDVD